MKFELGQEHDKILKFCRFVAQNQDGLKALLIFSAPTPQAAAGIDMAIARVVKLAENPQMPNDERVRQAWPLLVVLVKAIAPINGFFDSRLIPSESAISAGIQQLQSNA